MQREVRARQPGADGARPASDRRRIRHAVADDLDGAAAFGHQDRVVDERHAPRILEAARVDAHLDGLPLGGLVAHRRSGSGGILIPCGATGVLLRIGTSCWAVSGARGRQATRGGERRRNPFINRSSPGNCAVWHSVTQARARAFAGKRRQREPEQRRHHQRRDERPEREGGTLPRPARRTSRGSG